MYYVCICIHYIIIVIIATIIINIHMSALSATLEPTFQKKGGVMSKDSKASPAASRRS